MPDLRSFEVLLAVARTGSVGAAARVLGIAQQSVSARLSSLETLAGVQLVLRGPRGSQLLPEGAVLAEWAEQLISVAERVDTGMATLREENRNQVRVAASFTVVEQLMPRWLVSMRAEAIRQGGSAPDVILTAMNSNCVASAVHGHEAQLGFVEGPRLPKFLRSKVVANDELVVVAPPNHKWARRSSPITAEELRQTPLVLREQGSGTRESLVAALRRLFGADMELAPPVAELSSVTAVRSTVLAGAGPTVLSRLSVADDVTLDRLRVIDVAELDLKRKIRAVWQGARMPPEGGVRLLLSHITRQRVLLANATGRGYLPQE